MSREPELFCDGSSGIYIPQRFATEVDRSLVSGVAEEDWKTLEEGPTEENEWYFEAWSNVIDNCTITTPDGTTWCLYQDGDLWAVPTDYDIEEFFL